MLESQDEIEQALIQHFTEAFKKRRCWSPDWFDEDLGRVPDAAWQSLDAPFSEMEVKTAVFSIEGDKAPGPDGFGARFYQEFWSLVKEDILAMFSDFFSGDQGLGCLNATFFTLIPKKVGAVEVGDFRPISLVNGSYKLIAKVLANRLKIVIASMIEENQTAFIPGRLLQDGFMVTQERISAVHRDKRSGIVIKLDFSKAYDNVDWDFLLKVLSRHGFEPNWLRMVRDCISTAKASVLVNGKPCGFFHLNKGLRQGDPLSPLLFVSGVVQLANIFRCNTSEFPFRHLGLPLHLGKFLKAEWSPLIERFEQRLEGWKSNLLSIGGRLILLQSVLTNLPIFFLSVFKIPKGVLARIDAIRKRFLWCGLAAAPKKVHLVKWEVVCSSKQEGGLGVLNLEDMNKALLSKWIWRCLSNQSIIWRSVVEARYRCPYVQIGRFPCGAPRPSQIWTGILKATAQINEALRWTVGKGCQVRFWKDDWVGDSSLEDRFPILFEAAANKDGMVNQFWSPGPQGSHWTVSFRRGLTASEEEMLADLRSMIQGEVIDVEEDDIAHWRPHPSLNFSLLTRGYRAKWAPLADASCPMCREELETSNHLMLHCPAITQIWNRLAAVSDVVFALTSMEDLWRSGKRLSDKRDKSAKAKIFQILIPTVAWSHWLSRNHLVFRGTPVYVENI
ncbi:hypothetical protein QJS10_CPA03g01353 [Acorus calamus]|uniref:Reverse transcriptase domain-containing protein n=1 Tax=Acorus calamus TaxID=4465 RepID=A0AAV9F4E6_ACOCL|nr:hypothetical protein QJS10_CPA03g01353 [Acorus calamus]